MQLEAFLALVGDRIRRARLVRKLTQEQAAARLDMLPRYYQKIEAGQVNATMRTLFEVSRVLGRTVAELVDVEPIRNPTPLGNAKPMPMKPGRKPKRRPRPRPGEK